MAQKILSTNLSQKNRFDQVIIPTIHDIEEIKIRSLLSKVVNVLISHYRI